jgi:putative NADH-flavin reductase
MKVSSLEAIFRALQEAQARYLVVGGVASSRMAIEGSRRIWTWSST